MISETLDLLKQKGFNSSFAYFPAITDRDKWDSVPGPVKSALIGKAERLTVRVWESLPATRYLDYTRNGDRSRFQDIYYAKRKDLMTLVTAECTEKSGRFIDPIIDGSWSICEETTWCVPAHNNGYRDGQPRQLAEAREPIIDLFAAQTAAAMSAVLVLVGDELTAQVPQVYERIHTEIQARIITPFIERDDFWWMGFTDRPVNNWNPWIISNILLCLFHTEGESGRLRDGVVKCVRCLGKFMDVYTDDGGCDEGSSYWGRAGGSLFDCADILLEATSGAINWFENPKVAEMGRFITYAHISDDYFVNFADGPGVLKHHSPQLVYRFGKRIGDERMQALGAEQYRRHGMGDVDQSAIRSIPGLFLHQEIGAFTVPYRPVPGIYLPGIQFMTSRCGPQNRLFVAAKGGNNAESHNHNDVGNFIIYPDGMPAVIDAGVGTYTAKTFSSQRYDIWYMRSDHHNLPTINGATQIQGVQPPHSGGQPSAAENGTVHFLENDVETSLTMDLTPFYPDSAKIDSCTRTVSVERQAGTVTVGDSYLFSSGANIVEMHLMTAQEPVLTGTSAIDVCAGESVIHCALSEFYEQPVIEAIQLSDDRLSGVWGSQIFRTTMTAHVDSMKADLSIVFSQDR